MSRLAFARFHGFTLDTTQRLLLRDRQVVHLTRKAFDLLAELVERAPAVVTKHELHRSLWPETFVTDSTVAGVVKELRRALLQRAGEPPLIRTVHGVGYAFAGTIERDGIDETSSARCWLVAGERRVRLEDGVIELGRDPDVAIWIDSPDASRRHARILLAGTTAVIEDLHSKNGTLLNDRPITAAAPLNDGDVVRVGTVRFVFRVARPAASTVTAAGGGFDDAS